MAVLYATFNDASLAEKAAGALLDHGARQEDISIVANDEYGQSRTTTGNAVGVNSGYTDTTTGVGGHTASGAAAGVGRGVSNVGDSALDATKSAGHRVAQAADRTAAAVTGAVGATGTAANYDAAADQHAGNAEARAAMAGHETLVHGSASDAAAQHDAYATNAVSNDPPYYKPVDDDPNAAGLYAVDPNAVDPQTTGSHTEHAAKTGISTTTGADAAKGAAEGAGIGLGLGVLGGLATLFVPGFGLVLGGGALAAAIAAAAGTTAAGAIAGGVTGYLKDMGMPAEVATDYDSAVQHGGAMLSLNVPSGNLDAPEANELLSKYGASNVRTY